MTGSDIRRWRGTGKTFGIEHISEVVLQKLGNAGRYAGNTAAKVSQECLSSHKEPLATSFVNCHSGWEFESREFSPSSME
jgi:hypothetical protein